MSTAGMDLEASNNWMLLEPHLVDAVKVAVAGMSPAVQVLTAAELADFAEAKQPTPAIHVVYQGYRVVEDIGVAWRLAHTWLAVAACRSAAQIRSGSKARQDAGALAARVAMRMAGAEIPGATTRLTLVSPPQVAYSAPYVYMPTAFQVETIFRQPSLQD